MEFIKYPKVRNCYDKKFINSFSSVPELVSNTKFIVTEKLHGANFAVYVSKDKIKYAKRTSLLKDNENFFSYQEVMEKYIPDFKVFKVFQYYKTGVIDYIIIYGELFGSGINKGIDYGNKKDFRIFDVAFVKDNNIKMLPWDKMNDLLLALSLKTVPVVAKNLSFEEALNLNIEFPTKINPKEGNICEGIVIKPQYTDIYNHYNERFILKKKNDKFMEKHCTPKMANKEDEKEYRELLNKVGEYLNENRIESVFSKEGKIESNEEIGKYIKLVLKDIYEDAENDGVFGGVDKKLQKKVFGKLSNEVARMLIKTLF